MDLLSCLGGYEKIELGSEISYAAEEFSPEDLAYQPEVRAKDPETGEEVTIVEEDLLAGLNKLMRLEGLNGQSVLDRRGELRTQFYLHMARKPGERVADYTTVVSDMKSDGVNLPDTEVGWFFKDKLGLDALRGSSWTRRSRVPRAVGPRDRVPQAFPKTFTFKTRDKGGGRLTIRRIATTLEPFNVEFS